MMSPSRTKTKIYTRFRNRAIRLNLVGLTAFFAERPVPLPYWTLLRSFAAALGDTDDPLFPNSAFERTKGSEIGIPELYRILQNRFVGLWSLDKATIQFLWKRLSLERPSIVIECGAGLSTLVLGTYCKQMELRFHHRACVFSLEQNEEIAQEVQQKLTEYHLSGQAKVLFTPISVEGRYMLSGSELFQRLGPEKADWLVIDGPAGPHGCRQWTIPVLSPFCRQSTRWFLDDSFRDGELEILRTWSRTSGIEVQGIYPFGKGLATGLIRRPKAVWGT